MAAIGYTILGAAAGSVRLLVAPHLVVDSESGRIANLVLTPVAAGLFMSVLGSWRSRKGLEVIRLDRFGYGFVFALATASVRFVWAHG